MLNSITNLGKWLFIVPFCFFGVMHLTSSSNLVGVVPSFLPGGVFWVFVSGLAELAFGVSVILGKWDKLAAILCSILLLIYILSIHLPGIIGGYEMAISSFVKDIGLMGGALMYAKAFAKDSRGVN